MTTAIAPPANGNPGIVPPWMQGRPIPLPDPLGDTPTILPIDDDEWQHRAFSHLRVAENMLSERLHTHFARPYESGQTFAEYMVVLGIVVIAIFTTLAVLSGGVAALFDWLL